MQEIISTFASQDGSEIINSAQVIFGKFLFYAFIAFTIILVVVPVAKFGLELLKSGRNEEDNTKQIVVKWAIRIVICLVIAGILWGLYAIPAINNFIKP